LSNSDYILEFLEEDYSKQYCDDCLSTQLNIRPRQQVNQICRRLEQEGKIIRIRFRCDNCNKIKITNKLGSKIVGIRKKEHVVKGEKIKLLEDELKNLSRFKIEEIRTKIVKICQKIWAKHMKEEAPHSISKIINTLRDKDHIPSHQANMMLTICNLRNSYVYDGLELGNREKIIAYYAWEIIYDWYKILSE